jgi:LacI family transcriptional regulator
MHLTVHEWPSVPPRHSDLSGYPLMSAINQQALADRLNLSRTTVSRSLSNHPAISPETRARVLEAAMEMGYRGTPTRTIRRSRQSKPVTIGVVIGVPGANVEMATFPFVLQGIRRRAEMEHVAVDVAFENPPELASDLSSSSILRNIRTRDWRGTILIYPFPEAAVDGLARKISTVAVLESYNHPEVDTIDTDDFDGISAQVRRLIAAGHRKIGYVTWHYPVGGHWTMRRFGAYVEALFTAGVPFNPDWTCNVQKPYISKDAAIAQFVADRVRRHDVTAWVCAADHQAYHLIQDLEPLGISVPKDCSITGFDGVPPPSGMPQVASMRVPHEDIGQSAVSRLLGRILHPRAPRRKILVEAQPVEGTTIAPPPV